MFYWPKNIVFNINIHFLNIFFHINVISKLTKIILYYNIITTFIILLLFTNVGGSQIIKNEKDYVKNI